MKKILLLSVGFVALSNTTFAQTNFTVSVDANRSCMPWIWLDLATGNRFGTECSGYNPERQFVVGSCTFDVPAAEPYQFQWGGQDSWPIRLTSTGNIEYRSPQEVDSLQPNGNSITFNTTRLGLRDRGFPDVFELELDSTAPGCDEDPDPARRARRRFVVNGAEFLMTGSLIRPDGTVINAGGLFEVRADGELEKLVLPSNEDPFGRTQDPFIVGLNPNRVIVNRAFWGFETNEEEGED